MLAAPSAASAPPPWRRPLGLAGRAFVGTAAVVVAVLVAALAAASATVRRAGDAAAERGLDQAADLVAQFLAGRQRSLAGGARVFAKAPYFRALVAAQRRDDVLDQAVEAAEQLGADWVFITDGAGRLLAKSDEPGASGAALGAVPLVGGALRGQATAGFGVSRDSLLFQAVAVPVAVPGGVPLGVLVATKVVDEALARDVRAATAAEVVFYALDAAGRPRVAASTLGRGPEARRAVAALAAARDARRAPLAIGGVAYLARGATATTAGGEVVGGFAVLRGRDAERAELAGVQRSLLGAGGVGLALALVAAWVAARRVTRPVRALAEAARRAAEGDFRAEEVLRASGAGTGDEVGALGAAFGAMLADLRDQAALDAVRALPDAAARDAGRAATADPARRLAAAGARTRGPAVRPTPPHPGGARPTSARPTSARPPLALGGPPGGPFGGPRAGAVLAGRYQLESPLGSGGAGVVWRARDRALGEVVAVKVLRADAAARGPAALERFKDELRLARRIAHRNVVRLHDFGEDAGTCFLTMEYVDGASLAALLAARGALPRAAVLGVAKQLARALEAAHAQGVLHGDLKPANLMVGAGGVLKVADFGVARLAHAPARGGGRAHEAEGGAHIGGAVLGTPAFLAPEVLLGAPPSVRSDLYAAGLVVHACLTGETPFDGDTPAAFFAHKLDGQGQVGGSRGDAAPRPPSGPSAPWAPRHDPLAAAVARLAAREPAERPASARAMYEAFARVG